MLYFTSTKATLDDVLAGSVTSTKPTSGYYMSEDLFGTVVDATTGATKVYTTFTGTKGSSYYDLLGNPDTAQITKDGYFRAGNYVWRDGVRLSDLLKTSLVYTKVTDGDGKNPIGIAGYSGIPFSSQQMFVAPGVPINGMYAMNGTDYVYFLDGFTLASGGKSLFVFYDANWTALSGSLTVSKGKLSPPAGTVYVAGVQGTICKYANGQLSPLPILTTVPEAIGVQVKYGNALVMLATVSGGNQTPDTAAGPWFDLQNYKPISSMINAGNGMFMSGSSGLFGYVPQSYLIVQFADKTKRYTAPSDVHFANELPITANTGSPFISDSAGNLVVYVGYANPDADPNGFVNGVSIKAATADGSTATIDTYADRATNPTTVLLPDGTYSIGKVANYMIVPPSFISFRTVMVILLLVLIASIIGGAFMVYKHRDSIRSYIPV